MRHGRGPFGFAPRQFGLVDQQVDPAVFDIQLDAVAIAHQTERPADGGFRHDMQHDGAEGGAGHAGIRNPHHVLDALLGQFARDRQIARFGHAGGADRSGIAQHQHIVGRNIEIGIVHPQGHVFHRLKHHGAAFMLHQGRRGGRLLDQRALRGEIAAQYRHRARGLQRIGAGADDGLVGHFFGPCDGGRQRFAGHRQGRAVDQIAKFFHQFRHAPGPMEMLHIMGARRFEIDQRRHLAAHAVELRHIDLDAQASGKSGQMHKPVGGTTDRLKHCQSIMEGGFGHDFGRFRPAGFGHLDCPLASRFGCAQAVGMGGGN